MRSCENTGSWSKDQTEDKGATRPSHPQGYAAPSRPPEVGPLTSHQGEEDFSVSLAFRHPSQQRFSKHCPRGPRACPRRKCAFELGPNSSACLHASTSQHPTLPLGHNRDATEQVDPFRPPEQRPSRAGHTSGAPPLSSSRQPGIPGLPLQAL